MAPSAALVCTPAALSYSDSPLTVLPHPSSLELFYGQEPRAVGTIGGQVHNTIRSFTNLAQQLVLLLQCPAAAGGFGAWRRLCRRRGSSHARKPHACRAYRAVCCIETLRTPACTPRMPALRGKGCSTDGARSSALPKLNNSSPGCVLAAGRDDGCVCVIITGYQCLQYLCVRGSSTRTLDPLWCSMSCHHGYIGVCLSKRRPCALQADAALSSHRLCTLITCC